jgi:hypothetical protein
MTMKGRSGRHVAARLAGRGGESLYDKLVASGAKMDHHESDLYVRASPQTWAIIRGHGGSQASNARTFMSEGVQWIDIPFAYEPFWRAKAR